MPPPLLERGEGRHRGAVVLCLRMVTGQPGLVMAATSSEGPAPQEGRVTSRWEARLTRPFH